MDDSLRAARTHGYESARSDIQALVPLSARLILDVGCSTGALGAALKARQGATVVGVELVAEYAAEAERRLDRVHVADAAAFLAGPGDEEGFDCVIFADVLEHLVDPWAAVRNAVMLCAPGATVIASVPNVLEYRGLRRLVRQRSWPRDAEGPFDATHLRWFARRDVIDLLTGAGLTIQQVVPSYWDSGWRLTMRQRLGGTWLGDFLPVQWIVAAMFR